MCILIYIYVRVAVTVGDAVKFHRFTTLTNSPSATRKSHAYAVKGESENYYAPEGTAPEGTAPEGTAREELSDCLRIYLL